MIRERVFELTIASLIWLTYLVNIRPSVLSVEKIYILPRAVDKFRALPRYPSPIVLTLRLKNSRFKISWQVIYTFSL